MVPSPQALRVLYIDDDRVNALLFAEACRYAGDVVVEAVENGVQALAVAPQWRPDLLVIDLHLPDTDGYALLGALRRLLDAPTLPAYLCTADAAQQVRAPARAAGFDGCWTKPIDLALVLAELNARSAARRPPTPAHDDADA